MIEIDDSKVFFEVSGKEYCNDELALAILLAAGVLFSNERSFLDIEPVTDGKGAVLSWNQSKEIAGSTTILFVNCNDLFAWGCADSEDLPHDEIGNLYRMYIADPKYGVDKWCCFRRKQKPQDSIIEQMKKDGVWDERMEALP